MSSPKIAAASKIPEVNVGGSTVKCSSLPSISDRLGERPRIILMAAKVLAISNNIPVATISPL